VVAGLPRLIAHPLGRLWPREAGAHVCDGVARSVHPMRAASHSAAAFKTDTLAAQAAGNDGNDDDDDDDDDDDITKNGTAGVTSSASILGRAVASTLSGISGLLAGGSKRGGGSGDGVLLCKAPLARVWKLAVGAALDVDDDDDDDVDGGDDDDDKTTQAPVQIAPCRACRGSPLDCAFAGSGPLFASPVHAMARAGQRVAIARVLAAHGDRSVRRTRGKKKLRKKNTFKN
jgi:hypothetical protein